MWRQTKPKQEQKRSSNEQKRKSRLGTFLRKARKNKSLEMQDLYLPLKDSRHEIRLVTIEPEQADSVVRCRLHHVSLNNVKDGYATFQKTSTTQGTTRQLTNEWIHSCKSLSGDGTANTSITQSISAHPKQCRYTWGDFTALSYVWGNSKDQQTILLNGAPFPVTANLEIALRSLAKSGEFRDQHKVWIDAICINQDDDIERASQISKMREIYGGALSVLAWLGESDGTTSAKEVFQFLSDLSTLEPHEQEIAIIMADGRFGIQESIFFLLHELMIRSYWSRLWIVQEIVMGASATTLRCGFDTLDWTTFAAGVSVLYSGNNWTLKDTLLQKERMRRHIAAQQGWQTMSLHLVQQDLRMLCQNEESAGERLGFRRLLEIAGAAECRDARDSVFALSGMMDPAIAIEITRHYNDSLAALFAATTRAFVCCYDNLEPLRQANPWGAQGAPSWAADWTWHGRMRWSRPETEFAGPLSYPSVPEPKPEKIYTAHGGIPASYTFANDDYATLRCDGFVFDEIAGLGANEHGYFDWDPDTIQQFPTWESAYGDEQATAFALSRAVIGSCVSKGSRSGPQHVAVLKLPSTFASAEKQFLQRGWTWLASQSGYYFKWQRWRQANDGLLLGSRALVSFFEDQIPEGVDEQTMMEVYAATNRAVMERRFMLTKAGRFGWAPDNAYDSDADMQARIGDRVAVVFGCSTPLIVRPLGGDDDAFLVVGEAYVEGCMDGEAVSALQRGESERRTFTFR